MSDKEACLFEVRTSCPRIAFEEVCDLYTSVGWNHALNRTVEKVSASFEKSLCYFSAVDEKNRLIGICRIVGDGVFVFQLVDLITHPEFRRKGVAGHLLRAASAWVKVRNAVGLMLVDGSGIEGFYERFLFKKASLENVYYL